MATSKQFYDTVNAAVNDMAEHGFDDVSRVAYWTEQIRRSAAGAMKTTAQMEELLRRTFGAVYKKLVERGAAVKQMPGVARFTLDRVRPQLRAELDRRIMASASLIKLNREEAIEKTLRRFQGWATSIPVGGSAEPDKRKAKDDVRKSVAGLLFTERRVLVDQGHKLVASINETVAVGGGAIALIWHSHWKSPGYDYREDHKERDGHCYTIRNNWAQERGLMKPGPDGYYDQITQVAEEVSCRCFAQYYFHLRQLPPEMLTAKGRAELERVKVN